MNLRTSKSLFQSSLIFSYSTTFCVEPFLGGRSLSIAFDLFSILVFGIVLGYFNMDVLMIFMAGTLLFMGWTLLFLKKKANLDHKLFNLNRKDQSLLIQLIT